MASFQIHTDPLVTCPYNAAHRVKKSRLQIHLTKCKKHHVELDLRECPYNAQHRIPPSVYQYHLSTCKDRRLVERQINQESSEDHKGSTIVPPYRVDTPEVEECWDEIPSTRPGYDPRKRLETGHFILIPKGQPVDRRNAYKKMFTSPTLNGNMYTETNGYAENVKPAPEPEMKPIRVPKATPEVLQFSGSLGRGGQPTVRRKIAANIFGGSMGTSNMAGEMNPALGHGPPGVAVGLGRGLGRGRTGVGHPPLAPGQVQYLP